MNSLNMDASILSAGRFQSHDAVECKVGGAKRR